MKVLCQFVVVVAAAVVSANAYGEIADVGSPRVPFGVRCDPLKVCEFPRADFALEAELSPGDNVTRGGIVSQQWTERFVTLLGLGLFLTWLASITMSARIIAIASAGCLAVFFQLIYLCVEATDGLDGSPLFPHVLLGALSCCVVACLAAVSQSFFLRPDARPFEKQIARAALPALLPAFFLFEILYVASRLPVISPVSLSLALRPWTRLMQPTFVVFFAVWFASFLCLFFDSRPSGPGPDGAADVAPGPEAR